VGATTFGHCLFHSFSLSAQSQLPWKNKSIGDGTSPDCLTLRYQRRSRRSQVKRVSNQYSYLLKMAILCSYQSNVNANYLWIISTSRQERITTNKSHSFLVITEKDIGDLLMLKFIWKESTSSLLTLLSSWWHGDSTNFDVQIHKVQVRAGETQKKYVPTI